MFYTIYKITNKISGKIYIGKHQTIVCSTPHRSTNIMKERHMDMKALEITAKMMVGEDVSEEEKSYTRIHNAKYVIVRHLVMEKLSANKSKELKNFHFTPGEDFMTIPTVDVVNSVIKMFSELQNAVSVEFGDGSWDHSHKYGYPPSTGKSKTKLEHHRTIS